MLEIGGLIAEIILTWFFYKEWWNLNIVKILFCKVAVPLV